MILWDDGKNQKLRLEWNISFDQIAELILRKEYLAILDHPSRLNQQLFVLLLNGYVHVVPQLVDRRSILKGMEILKESGLALPK